MSSYSVAVTIFCMGVFTTICVVAYILGGNKKSKGVDPFEGE